MTTCTHRFGAWSARSLSVAMGLAFALTCMSGCASSSDAPSDEGPADNESDNNTGTVGSDEGALTASSSERQTVYDEVRGSAHRASDLLSSRITDERLVKAVGWLVDNNAPDFYITAIRTDHHNDGPRAHAGGFCMDFYAQNSGDARQLVELANRDPYVVEIGLGGAYKAYRHAVTDKAYFNDNNATHIHIGVVHAFGN